MTGDPRPPHLVAAVADALEAVGRGEPGAVVRLYRARAALRPVEPPPPPPLPAGAEATLRKLEAVLGVARRMGHARVGDLEQALVRLRTLLPDAGPWVAPSPSGPPPLVTRR